MIRKPKHANKIKTNAHKRIKALAAGLKKLNTPGEIISTKSPIMIIEAVYVAMFAARHIVAQLAGMESLTIKYPLAGCPPVEDGVMAEKYKSAAV